MTDKAGLLLKPNIYIDVTETLATGKATGIERVVRRITDQLTKGKDRQRVHVVAALDGQFYKLNTVGLERLMSPTMSLAGHEQSSLSRVAVTILSQVPHLFLVVLNISKSRRFRPLVTPMITGYPVSFYRGDVIVLLDSYWGGVSSIVAARRARDQGAKVISAIYDLIPITHPHFMTASIALAFPRKLMEALKISKGALAISESSANELRHWLGRRLPNLKVLSFPLGYERPQSPTATREGNIVSYTMVGTIEPRKGHEFVLHAFEERWLKGDTCTLTFVGRMGWVPQSTQTRMTQLIEDGHLKVIHGANDDELATIMQATDALIMASKVEGFGLPIIEALTLGIPTLLSRIDVFEEIAGKHAVYFDPFKVDSLIDAMKEVESCPSHWRALAMAFTWPTWGHCAEIFLSEVDLISAEQSN